MSSIFCDTNYALTVLNLMLLLTINFAVESQAGKRTETKNYCPYFKNRAPSPQPDLKNCTWYRESSCCLQHELEITFANTPPPDGASEKCRRYMNYLMCYVCAPNQNVFYSYAQERLTVCEGFCNQWFDACGDAQLKGTKIRNAYKSGKEFCIARKFSVKEKSSSECFSYNGDRSSKSSASKRVLDISTILVFLVGGVTSQWLVL